MYKGKRARFTRNALDSVADIARKIFVKYINPTNLIRLQKTLDLSDVSDEKPSINGVMIPIQTRLDEEERQAEYQTDCVYRYLSNHLSFRGGSLRSLGTLTSSNFFDSVSFFQFYQTENGIVQHVHIVGINAFRH